MANFYQLAASNKAKSNLIIALFIGFVTATTYVVSQAFGYGPDAVLGALVFSSVGSLVSYFKSDQIVLSISGAKEAIRNEHFDFYTVAQNLSQVAKLPMPKLYVIEDSALNAFATGRDPQHAAVAATTGLLAKLSRTQLEGVVAHELSHIKNYDTRLMTIVAILVGTLTMLGDWFFRIRFARDRDDREGSQFQAITMIVGFALVLLSPIIAQLIQLAISRRREFLADASAVSLTKYPEGLASALEVLSHDKEPLEVANKATAHLYISNPLKNLHSQVGWFANLFNTHPPIGERIRALRG